MMFGEIVVVDGAGVAAYYDNDQLESFCSLGSYALYISKIDILIDISS